MTRSPRVLRKQFIIWLEVKPFGTNKSDILHKRVVINSLRSILRKSNSSCSLSWIFLWNETVDDKKPVLSATKVNKNSDQVRNSLIFFTNRRSYEDVVVLILYCVRQSRFRELERSSSRRDRRFNQQCTLHCVFPTSISQRIRSLLWRLHHQC